MIDVTAGSTMFGLTILLARQRTVLLADTLVHEVPSAEQLAISRCRRPPRRANSGSSRASRCCPTRISAIRKAVCGRVRDAIRLLDEGNAGFEYDGEMSADVALDERLMRQLYPFCRLSGPANILVMPDLHSANIARSCCRTSAAGPSSGLC